jgi:hypothetical protein
MLRPTIGTSIVQPGPMYVDARGDYSPRPSAESAVAGGVQASDD